MAGGGTMRPSRTKPSAARSSKRCCKENGCGRPQPLFSRERISRVLDVLLEAGIDQLALQKGQRCLPVQFEVVEGVGDDLGHPDEARLDVADEEQVDGAEQQP